MAKHKKNKSLGLITPTWSAIASAMVFISCGFTVGCYYKEINHKIAINEINRKHQEDLSSQKEKYDNLIIELRHANQLLEIQNAKLKK
mgnify:CR=1